MASKNNEYHSENIQPQCILHTSAAMEKEEIKLFDIETWTKVTESNVIRKSKPKWNLSIYSTICLLLPDNCSKEYGYHSICYKNFTAVTENSLQDTYDKSHVLLRSNVNHPVTGSAGKFQQTCIFCLRQKVRRKCQLPELLGYCENRESETRIKESAELLHDQEMIARIGSVDFVAKGVQYHHSCRKQYINKATRKTTLPTNDSERNSSGYMHTRTWHNEAFVKLKNYIDTHIIGKQQPELLTSLHGRYRTLLAEFGCSSDNINAYFLGQKVIKCYEGQLEIGKLSNRQGNVIFPSGIEESDAVNAAIHSAGTIDVKADEVALYIRKLILELKASSHDFPYPLTAETLMKGQVQPPDLLMRFLRVLFTGSDMNPDDRVQRYVESVSDDCLFACTKGFLKPSKHVCLGLGLKSLTGSRKVLEILNHLGHCCSYHTIEGFETDLAMSVSDKGHATPDGILRLPGLSTALAWDNYDEMTETLSGSGSLHDTVGICYQNTRTEAGCPLMDITTSENLPKRKRRSRMFDSPDNAGFEPYRKKPKISIFEYRVKGKDPPNSVIHFKRRDQLWTLMCSEFTSTPMWTGWNSSCVDDTLPVQAICYMENLTLPPTRLDVVVETLRLSQKVAEECQEEYAVVHYDLAIAKPAKQIQQTESPKFDNVFICFGPFHIQLAYFGSLGYIIDESGGPHILTDTNVLARGSLNGFISGRHYNRCKRLHPLLCQAFKILHTRAFLRENRTLTDEMKAAIQHLNSTLSTEALNEMETLRDYDVFMAQYEEYSQRTRNGEHGKTAQYWMMYMDLVQLHLLFSRACHTNDLDLFIYSIGEMVKVFFATSRPNYSRWMLRYYLDLLNMDETHPGVRQLLEGGAFTVRRTSKSFSRCPVDLTLEQTINADAASRLTGISSFSTLIGARRRWMLTQSSRRTVVSHLMSKAGMNTYIDPVQELKPSRIEKDNNDLQKLICGIQSTMNTFDLDCRNDNLHCLSTGKVMSQEIATDLLQLEKRGEQWQKEFENGCFMDASRFEKPIPRRKVKNFADSAVKMQVTCKDHTIRQLRCSRDLFGRLLFLATTKDLDLKKIFSFPLTPVPLSLSHIDGTPMKTDKSKLMKLLESKIVSEPPDRRDATIVDGMFFIQTLCNIPSTFGEVAKLMLSRLASLSKRVDFVCDTYNHPSIKDIERSSRGSFLGLMTISGPDQRRPKEFQKALQSESFKTSLLTFLSEEWSKDRYAPILKDCHLHFGIDDKCYSFTSDNSTVTRVQLTHLTCNHDEADTRIVWHLKDICQQLDQAHVIIRCNDTDVLVILLNHVKKYNAKVWMDVGLNGTNNRRYVDVSNLSTVLGQKTCDALPAIHALTGCDYTAAFVRKGKVRPFNIVEKCDQYLDAFADLGNILEVKADTERILESYICTLYCKPALGSVDLARYAIFRTKFAPTNDNEPLSKIRGADAAVLPPSKPVLHQKLLRTNLVAYVWRHADQAVPLELDPRGNGWYQDGGYFKIQWYSGPQVPVDIDAEFANIGDDMGDIDGEDMGDIDGEDMVDIDEMDVLDSEENQDDVDENNNQI